MKGGRLLPKKKKIILTVAILGITLLAFIGGQTYDKYSTGVKGEGMAEVATWNFKINGQKEQVQSIPLISTCHNETLVNHKIAPGTSGSFNIRIDATGSDVGIQYHIRFSNESNKPTNLRFEYENVEYNAIQELQNNLSGVIKANDEDKQRIFNIKWKWDYETGNNETEIAENDRIDTQDAQQFQNYTFYVTITGTQIKPAE